MAKAKEWPDESKAFGADEIKWLHEWGLDYKIEENLRRFEQSDQHDEGIPPDVKEALRAAGIKPPPPPANPSFVDGAPLNPTVQVASPDTEVADDEDGDDTPAEFDDEAVKAELNTWTVPELKAELKTRELSDDGLKDDLVDRLFADVKSAHEANAEA